MIDYICLSDLKILVTIYNGTHTIFDEEINFIWIHNLPDYGVQVSK